jgi:hypothetical protein
MDDNTVNLPKFNNMKPLLNLSWWGYFLHSNLMVLWRALLKRNECIMTFRSASRVGSFVFSFFINLLIYLPLVGFIGTFINIQRLAPGFLVVTAFGLAFGVFFRHLINESLTYISFDGQFWHYECFGFSQKAYEKISQSEIKGVMLYEHKNIDRYNYKVALRLQDGRIILLYVSQLQRWSKKVFEKVQAKSGLKAATYEGGTPINDMNVGQTNPY